MSTVEVLAPLRLETRFVSPAQRNDGVNQWMLRLRVWPDEFSIRRNVPPPAPEELDRLQEAIAQMSDATLSEADAFAAFAASVGTPRALGLWRAHVKADPGGQLTVDRTGEVPHEPFAVHGPAGLPAHLDVWFVHTAGARQLVATLAPDLVEIGKDLDLQIFKQGEATLEAGKLPETWWLSYQRAKDIGLAADIDIGLSPPTLEALVVLGIGEADAADLVDAHNQGGHMDVLAPGTPTNTIAGEPTTDFGEHPETVYRLLHVDAAKQMSTGVVLSGLTGSVAPSALPMLGGDLDYYGPASLAVQGLWPVLWGRVLRDVIGAGDQEVSLARWAIRYLAVEGPRPAFRVGEQPYGLLPTSAFGAWVDAAADPLADIEVRIRAWALPWRAKTAAAARVARGRVADADVEQLVETLGVHAPSRYWNAHAIADLYQLQALRLTFGMAPLDTSWDDNTARALRGIGTPIAPIGRAPGEVPIPGPPWDRDEDSVLLHSLPTMEPEPLFGLQQSKLGLVGHLMREALIDARAIVGDAIARLAAATPISIGQPLPWANETEYRNAMFRGTNAAVTQLRASTDANGRLVADRFGEVQQALQVIADLWEPMSDALFHAVLAALETAAFRVDPWLIGIAERRLQRLIAEGAPFRLGAYGWVDAPAPYTGAAGGPLAPGPTSAGLLHAPSSAQALTAALLRDGAVRYPGDDRWKLTLDSGKIRSAIALAERVRLGLHPYEALGLEVEKIAGDWDVVRILRTEFPLASDQQERRVCDGQKVLKAAREGSLAAIAGIPATLAADLEPLDYVLDTYSDLLVTDGIHALVTGRADLANAAMEAAAGLGAPPELRAIRTPREATTVRVSAWALLPGAPAPARADADPARVADPAFAAAMDSELGPGSFEAVDAASADRRQKFAAVLGGADDNAPVPTLSGGSYEGLSGAADGDLRKALAADLNARLVRLVNMAQAAHAALAPLDPNDSASEAAVTAAAARWRIDVDSLVPEDLSNETATTRERLTAVVAALQDRLSATPAPAGNGGASPSDEFINRLKRGIRGLVGRPDLVVLPVVARSLLPVLRAHTDLDRAWLEIVAAVRPRLAPLEAHQLDAALTHWSGAVAAQQSSDPWSVQGPVVVAYGPGVQSVDATVAIAALDGWSDSVPSRRHATFAAFGFNAPKSRAPQAVLVAVPPDLTQRLDNSGLLDVVLETRELAHARAPRQTAEPTLPHPTSTALVSATAPRNFLQGWRP